MGNHVIYDRIWESRKLAECSRNAALAYPWIYLVADDHGRFEMLPRVIWAKVFGAREDIKAAEVAAWLDEYQRVGLLLVYEAAGKKLGVWTKFAGPPPSKRRPSALPDQEGFVDTEALKAKSRFHAASDIAGTWKPMGSQEQEAGSRKQEQEREQEGCAPSAQPNGRSVSVVPDPEAQEADYARAVFEAIDLRRGATLPPASSADFDVVRRWMRDGIPLRVALQGIRDCSKAPHARYVDKAVREEHARVLKALGGPWSGDTALGPYEPEDLQAVCRDAPALVAEFLAHWDRLEPKPELNVAFAEWREGRGISFQASAAAGLLRLASDELRSTA